MTRHIAVALFALAVLIGATVAADAVVEAPQQPQPESTEDTAVASGTWYCAPIVGDDQTATVAVAAVGDDPSQLRVERFSGGEATSDETIAVDPRSATEIEVGADDALVVRWRGGPAVASWRVDGAERVGASCASSPAPRWTIAGAETTIGSSTRLQLFNPFDGDAVVRVAFASPEGRIDLVSSESVSVPAREVRDVSINELQPEQPDLGLLVEVEAGRVIANAVQRFGQPELTDVELEGAEPPTDPTAPDGRAVLPASSRPSSTLGLAYAVAGESTTAWVSVVNPSEQPATVRVEVTDPIAGSALEQQIVIGPASVERVDLTGVSSAPEFGVTIRSTDDVPLTATGFVALIGDDKRVSATAAVPEADVSNALPIVPADSGANIALYNPGDTAATATVAVDGEVPDAWSSIELPAGTMQVLSFGEAGVADGRGPVEASADQPIYATVRLATADDRAEGFLLAPLVPANVWQGSADAPVPVRDRTLDTRPVDFPVRPEQ